LSALITYLYKETGFYDYAAVMPRGEQRQANLRGLQDKAKEFDGFAFRGLNQFVDFLKKLQEEDELGEVKTLAENADVVRIMSMHKSKGLEFPIVFLADLGKQFNLTDQRNDVLLHKELGVGLKVVDPSSRIKYNSFAHNVIKGRTHRETLAEEMRILYVAMTRARETLILVGSQAPMERVCKTWTNGVPDRNWPLSDDLLVSANSYLDWLGPSLVRHEDGGIILQAAGTDNNGKKQANRTLHDPSHWFIYLEGYSEPLDWFESEQALDQRDDFPWRKFVELEPVQPQTLTRHQTEFFNRHFLWEYPNKVLGDLPQKLSVTELKNWFQSMEDDESLAKGHVDAHQDTQFRARRPRFVLEERERVSAVEQGIWTHTLLQCLDLGKALGDETILYTEARRLVKQGYLTKEQLAQVNLDSIIAFFKSELGKRLLKRPKAVWRELPFTMSVPVEKVYSISESLPTKQSNQNEGTEDVVIQGVIDCVVQEPDGLLLIDFKTDRINPRQAAQRALEYEVQIQQYCRAAACAVGKDVEEAYLYFLRGGVAVSMPIPDRAKT
ncbi:MAG: hypothetical protein GX316_04615, partial [Firmicutes bacterium]|nr:hypothetical protein [Bacillota bacterium]